MDQNRQIRFLIPPFFLFSSLLWGIYWSDSVHLRWHDMMQDGLLTYIGIAVASTLPLGFLIGTITVLLLKIFSLILGQYYETITSKGTFEKMSKGINTNVSKIELEYFRRLKMMRIRFNTVVIFDHEILYNNSKGTHEWLIRRWSAVNISFSSIIALFLALVTGLILEIPVTPLWKNSTYIMALLLFITGIFAWRDIYKMFEFQSCRYKNMIENNKVQMNVVIPPPGAERR